MRISLPVGALILAAAASGWLVRGFGARASAAPVPVAAPAPSLPRVTEGLPAGVMDLSLPQRETLGSRDLFAYRERVIPREEPVIVPVVQRAPEIVPLPVEPEQPSAPPPPQFTWRFIGTVGAEHNRVAAFARDGEIVTVRTGELIGGDFVLRAIGIESVEVEPVSSGTGPQRIPLAGSVS